jgi:hypothetical protein
MMADKPKRDERSMREVRLQDALRQNLKRRKAQARGRAERTGTDSASEKRPLRATTEKGGAE